MVLKTINKDEKPKKEKKSRDSKQPLTAKNERGPTFMQGEVFIIDHFGSDGNGNGNGNSDNELLIGRPPSKSFGDNKKCRVLISTPGQEDSLEFAGVKEDSS